MKECNGFNYIFDLKAVSVGTYDMNVNYACIAGNLLWCFWVSRIHED